MPKTVKLRKGEEFNFAPARAGGGKYDWDSWFSGELLMLERSDVDAEGNVTGEKRDYEVPTDSMPPKIKTAARRRYKKVSISRYDANRNPLGEAVIIQARDMTPEERQAEDILRAEEKAALKEKKQQADSNGKATAAQPTPTPAK